MHWWDEAESRALRTRGAVQLALVAWQRMQEAGLDRQLTLIPAHGLAQVHMAGCDLVQVVDSLLVAPAGTLRLHLAELAWWCRGAAHWVEASARPFLLLLDGLKLDPQEWEAAIRADPEESEAVAPEAQAKQDGRYRHWHLLYERLDLKLEAEGYPPSLRRPLCRDLAEVYEEMLVLNRDLSGLLARTPPRWRDWCRFLVDFNATFHYHLGPRRLGHGQADPDGAVLGLQSRLLACLAYVREP